MVDGIASYVLYKNYNLNKYNIIIKYTTREYPIK